MNNTCSRHKSFRPGHWRGRGRRTKANLPRKKLVVKIDNKRKRKRKSDSPVEDEVQTAPREPSTTIVPSLVRTTATPGTPNMTAEELQNIIGNAVKGMMEKTMTNIDKTMTNIDDHFEELKQKIMETTTPGRKAPPKKEDAKKDVTYDVPLFPPNCPESDNRLIVRQVVDSGGFSDNTRLMECLADRHGRDELFNMVREAVLDEVEKEEEHEVQHQVLYQGFTGGKPTALPSIVANLLFTDDYMVNHRVRIAKRQTEIAAQVTPREFEEWLKPTMEKLAKEVLKEEYGAKWDWHAFMIGFRKVFVWKRSNRSAGTRIRVKEWRQSQN